jgi:hypothetical protein
LSFVISHWSLVIGNILKGLSLGSDWKKGLVGLYQDLG